MKTIKLKQYQSPVHGSIFTRDKYYHVSLGNGYKKSFGAEKDAVALLAQTNRDLTTKLYELNFLYSDVLRLYRCSWLYFDKINIAGFNNIETVCNNSIQGIEKTFNLIVDRAGWENGNYFVFSQLQFIISEIKSICDKAGAIIQEKAF